MIKDPLAKEDSYDSFVAAAQRRGATLNLSRMKTADFRRYFSEVRQKCGTAAAAEMLQEVTRPDRRMAMDIWSYHCVEEQVDAPGGVEQENILSVTRQALERCSAAALNQFPVLTDIDKADWSEDFLPFVVVPGGRNALRPDFSEMDPQDELPAPEPGF